jgi:preprotein translocase subunit YajC
MQEAGVAAAGAAQPSALIQMLPFAGILAVMYFLMIRPQQKRQKEHAAMIENLKKGDAIVTTGGLIGKVTKVEESEIVLDVGEGVKVRVVRSMVVDVRNKTVPEAANDTSKS